MNQSVSRQGCDQINNNKKSTDIKRWNKLKKHATVLILTQVHEKLICSHSDERLWNASRQLGVFHIEVLILTGFMWNGGGGGEERPRSHVTLRHISWYTSHIIITQPGDYRIINFYT